MMQSSGAPNNESDLPHAWKIRKKCKSQNQQKVGSYFSDLISVSAIKFPKCVGQTINFVTLRKMFCDCMAICVILESSTDTVDFDFPPTFPVRLM